ncbi:GNAT family N-acetyltransferase [Bacillus rubiinfantis]|uniref:GNAT family N-acetyltransferase n=1 Tax=Bacillus rubiinfantis TaxID=1499680 RepID=UPI000A9B6A69|nr:GNAT family N-acetyltransferase [Bacillus rubiinfantis]
MAKSISEVKTSTSTSNCKENSGTESASETCLTVPTTQGCNKTESIQIRQLTTFNELQQIQGLEKAIWNMMPMPIHHTLTAVKNGGIMIGAFQGDEIIGFSYGFAGFANGQGYLCSHMLGIVAGQRSRGIGALLKEAQKQAAIDKGYRMITWTYDPLESANAFLNLSKLRAICSTYIENCYGDMEDPLNRGLPSDRFQVEWWIQSKHIKENENEVPKRAKQLSYELDANAQPRLLKVDTSTFNEAEAVLVPIPKNFQQLKKENFELALDWRLKTRKIFQSLFAQGFAAVQLIKIKDEPVHYYLVRKRDKLQLESRDEYEN